VQRTGEVQDTGRAQREAKTISSFFSHKDELRFCFLLSVSLINQPECFFDARGDGGKGVVFRAVRTGEDLHVWRARPGVFGVGDNHVLILTGAEHPWVPVVWIQ